MKRKETSRHHKATDEKILIPKSGVFFSGECDLDEDGYPITYEILIWEYSNFLKLEANPRREQFPTKKKAEDFAKERLWQRLVAQLTVTRVRHLGWKQDRKIIYEYEQ